MKRFIVFLIIFLVFSINSMQQPIPPLGQVKPVSPVFLNTLTNKSRGKRKPTNLKQKIKRLNYHEFLKEAIIEPLSSISQFNEDKYFSIKKPKENEAEDLEEYFRKIYIPEMVEFDNIPILEAIEIFVEKINLLESELSEKNLRTSLSIKIKNSILNTYKAILREKYAEEYKELDQEELNKKLRETIMLSYFGSNKSGFTLKERNRLPNAKSEIIFAKLILAGANPNTLEAGGLGGGSISIVYPCPSLLGLIIIRKINTALIDLLYYYGANFNLCDNQDYYPITYALIKNDIKSLKKLINYGAKINKKFKKFDCPLLYLKNNFELSKLMAFEAFSTPLMLAAYRGSVDAVKLLLSYPNVNINHKNVGLFTALRCCFEGIKNLEKIYDQARAEHSEKKELLEDLLNQLQREGAQCNRGYIKENLYILPKRIRILESMPSQEVFLNYYIKIINMLLAKGANLGLSLSKSEKELDKLFEFLIEHYKEGLELLPSKDEILKNFLKE